MAAPFRCVRIRLVLALAVVALGAAASGGAQTAPRVLADPFLDADAPTARLVARSASLARVAKGKKDVVVDDDGLDCPDADFSTIQAAIDSGAEKIKVCVGTYPENVAIPAGSKVKLEGDGIGMTMITGVAGTAGPIIGVGPASRVDLEKLTVDGGSAMAGAVVQGILYTDADGKVKDVEVANIRNASGGAQGIGIAVRSEVGTSKVKVEDSIVTNYTRVGIYGNGAGTDLDAKKNVVTGPIGTGGWAPNGVQLSRWATGKVEDNVIDNNPSPNPPGGAGSGIILFCSGKVQVKKNYVADADLGVALAETSDAKIEYNTIVDSRFDGISVQFLGNVYGQDVGCGIGDSPTVDNEVKKNTIINAADTGISLIDYHAYYGLAPALGPQMLSGNRIKDNEIRGSAIDGIHVWTGVDNQIEKNEIDDSGDTDAVDDTAGSGTAGTANDWKKNQCDTSSPAGLC